MRTEPGTIPLVETRPSAPEGPEQLLEERIGRGDRVAMLFTAPWCPTGGLLATAITADAETPGGTAVDVIDVDTSPHIADRYLVVSLPTLVVVDGGREKGRLLGAFSARDAHTLLRRGVPEQVDLDRPNRSRKARA